MDSVAEQNQGSFVNQMDNLQSEKPDIIFITGDISTPGGTIKGYEEVLSKIKAPLGSLLHSRELGILGTHK